MIGFSGLGLLLCLLMKEIPMSETADNKFGLDTSGGEVVVELTTLGSNELGGKTQKTSEVLGGV